MNSARIVVYLGNSLAGLGPVPEGGACKYLVKLLYFTAILHFFAERVESFPRDV